MSKKKQIKVSSRKPTGAQPQTAQRLEHVYNGNLTSAEREGQAVELLRKPWRSLRGICEEIGMDYRSLRGIISRSPELQAIHRQAVSELHDNLARLAGEELARCVASGIVEPKVLATIYGIATDKGLATRAASPTGRAPEPIRGDLVDVLTPFAQLVHGLTAALRAPAPERIANAHDVSNAPQDHSAAGEDQSAVEAQPASTREGERGEVGSVRNGGAMRGNERRPTRKPPKRARRGARSDGDAIRTITESIKSEREK